MTTVPFMPIVEIITRIALTATASAPFLSPRPTQRPAAIAAASVTLTSSSARLRSGDSGAGERLSVMGALYRERVSGPGDGDRASRATEGRSRDRRVEMPILTIG